jgi:hypothetical protein
VDGRGSILTGVSSRFWHLRVGKTQSTQISMQKQLSAESDQVTGICWHGGCRHGPALAEAHLWAPMMQAPPTPRASHDAGACIIHDAGAAEPWAACTPVCCLRARSRVQVREARRP